jgi:hypothetical protein
MNYQLFQNHPNPFSLLTYIEYQIPRDAHVRVKVYDLLGQEVATLVDSRHQAGRYRIEFNGKDLSGGIYVYRLFVEGFSETKEMMLLK